MDDFFDRLHDEGFDIYDYSEEDWRNAYKKYNIATGKKGEDINLVPTHKGHSFENVLAIISGHHRKDKDGKDRWGYDNDPGPDIDDIQIKGITGADLKPSKTFLESKGYFDSAIDLNNPKNVRNKIVFTPQKMISLYMEEAKSLGTKYMAFVDPYRQKIYTMDLNKAEIFATQFSDDTISGSSKKKKKEGQRAMKMFIPDANKEYKGKNASKYNNDKIWKNEAIEDFISRRLEWFNSE